MRRFAPALALLLGGCMVGPDYRPAPPPPAATGGFVEPGGSTAALPSKWWRLYPDATLDWLVEEALRNNTDVRVAAANLKRARFVLAEARAGLLPTTQEQAQYSHIRQGTGSIGTTSSLSTGSSGSAGTGAGTGVGTGTGTGTTGGIGTGAGSGTGVGTTTTVPNAYELDYYQLGFNIAYELDLFGGVRRGIEAARGDYEATAAALDAARVAVAAETARSYAASCGYAAQVAVANETATLQGRTLDLTQRLNEGGRGTLRDVDQARTLFEQARADVSTFEAERRAALDALATLTGRPPAALDPVIATCKAPPRLDRPVPSGDGAQLLARRPDVRQAERKLAADTARIGVAVADLYPSITLLGAVSLGATRLGDIGKSKSLSYSLGPLISWNFPNQSVARARIRQAEATAEASLATFDGTVLTALKETEQALVRLQGETERNAGLRRADAAAADAARLTRARFDAGRDDFFQLLDAERTRAQVAAQRAASDTALIDDQVNLFRALGGGWEYAPEVNVKPVTRRQDSARSP